MLNNPLGTYAENDKSIATDDDLHCIRYSLLVPVAAGYVVARMPAVRLLLKESGVHSFAALIRCAHVLYKTQTGHRRT